MNPSVPRRGLYAVTDAGLTPGADALTSAVLAALRGGASVIQYRDKGDDAVRRRHEVERLLAVCREAGVPLLVNDDIELAAASGAPGVHLGRDDRDPAEAREQIGEHAIVGVSCYDSLALAEQAVAAGADYVAFGSFFPSAVKPHAVRPPRGLLSEAREKLGVPIVAIGGVTPENGADLLTAGADLLAVITGVFMHPDIEAAARRYARLFA